MNRGYLLNTTIKADKQYVITREMYDAAARLYEALETCDPNIVDMLPWPYDLGYRDILFVCQDSQPTDDKPIILGPAICTR